MSIILIVGLILLGIFSGLLSGIIGIGGGVIIIPALVLIFGLSQKMAQGTTLAILIPPIGILAALVYYKQGYVDLKVAALIIVGFVIGSFLGAKFAVRLPSELLSKIFAVTIIVIGIRMLISK
jgi:uncharacterized protein